jgi:hypothetical protein
MRRELRGSLHGGRDTEIDMERVRARLVFVGTAHLLSSAWSTHNPHNFLIPDKSLPRAFYGGFDFWWLDYTDISN